MAFSGKFLEAIDVAQKLYKVYPTNQDVVVLNAKLYFWNKNILEAYKYAKKFKDKNSKLYKNILLTYKLNTLKNIKDPKQKLNYIQNCNKNFQNNYDVLIVTIHSYLKLHKLHLAKQKAKKLVLLYPKSMEAKTMLQNITKWEQNALKSTAINGGMIGAGYKSYTYSNRDLTDNTKYVEFNTKLNSYATYVKLLHKTRSNITDDSIEAEIYPQQPQPYWAFLALGATADADFSSLYYVGWHQYMVVSNWQFATSYTYSKYLDTTAQTTTLEYDYYFTDLLYFKQTLYYTLSTNGIALLSELHYKTLSHLEWLVNYTFSKPHANSSTNSYNAQVEYPLNKKFSLGCSLGYKKTSQTNSSFFRRDLGVFVRGYLW